MDGWISPHLALRFKHSRGHPADRLGPTNGRLPRYLNGKKKRKRATAGRGHATSAMPSGFGRIV